MGIQLGKLLFGTTPASVNGRLGASVSEARGIVPSFKTSSYASIPYERAPQVVDTVPTRDASGNPLLPGYVTPLNSWIA